MSQGHLRSILPQRGGVSPVDNNTVALFHFDRHARDSIQGIEPIGNRKALNFNHSNKDYVIVEDSPELRVTNEITLEAWVYLESAGMSFNVIIDKGNYGSGYQLKTDSELLAYTSLWLNGSRKDFKGSKVELNKWTHLAITYDGAKVVFYIDGKKDVEHAATGKISTSSHPLRFGKPSGYDYCLDGSLSNVKVWSRALSEDEIKRSMNNVFIDETLVGYWKLDEGEGEIIYDHSNTGNDGVLYGGTWVEGQSIYSIVNDGVLVEEGTTNLITQHDLTKWTPYYTPTITKIEDFYRIETTAANHGVRYTIGTGLTAGKDYTFSYMARHVSGITNIGSHIGPNNNSSAKFYRVDGVDKGASNGTSIPSDGRWHKVEVTIKPLSGYTDGNIYIQPGRNGSGASTFDIKEPQLEEKSFATSFTEGTRENGKLIYPSKIVENPEGTISFWHQKKKPQSTITGQQTSPKLLQIGDYHSISSLTLWDFNRASGTKSTLAFYVRGTSSTGWTASGDTGFELKQGEWNMITLSWVGRKYSLYVNGELLLERTSSTDVGPFSGGRMYLGGEGGTKNNNEQGQCIIDELRIDKVARTGDEIRAWYYQGRSKY